METDEINPTITLAFYLVKPSGSQSKQGDQKQSTVGSLSWKDRAGVQGGWDNREFQGRILESS